MRFLTLCAIALAASLTSCVFSDSADAQSRISISKNNWGPNTVISGSSRPSGGTSSHGGSFGHAHAGHSHHSGSGFGYGSCYPYGSSYYSSYTNYYTPFGGSFFYGTSYPGYGYYNSGWGYPSGLYSFPTYQYIPTPVVVANYPPFTQPLIDAQAEAEARWAEELKLGSHIRIPIKPVVASSAQERLRAQRLQMSGDELFRKQSFSQAMRQYRQANSIAQDLPDPYFRMAVIYAIQNKFDAAVTYLKRTLQLDPDWPANGDTLSTLYGDDNSLARNALLIEVSRWVEEDIRDPDRLLLMGAFLYEFDREKAAAFLETSARLSGTTQYVAPYLNPVAAEVPQDPAAPDQPRAAPLPEGELISPPLPQRDPTLEQNQPDPKPEISPLPPPGIGFNSSRQGKIVIPTYKSPLKGPELPPLGN